METDLERTISEAQNEHFKIETSTLHANKETEPDTMSISKEAASYIHAPLNRSESVTPAKDTNENVFNQVPSYQSQKISFHGDKAVNVDAPQLSNLTMSSAMEMEENAPYHPETQPVEETTESMKKENDPYTIVPSYAAWFSLTDVHEIEKRTFPEFFGSGANRSPNEYVQIRDYMIHSWRRSDMSVPVSITACRRHLSVDVSIIIKIHAFLEQWGLINTNIDAKKKAALLLPSDTSHFKILAQTPKSILHLEPSIPELSISPAQSQVVPESTAPIDLRLYPNVMKETDHISKATAKGIPVYCTTCGTLCSYSYYHCLKAPFIQLCKACFYDGRFPSSYYSGDFIELSVSEDESSTNKEINEWSDQEVLYLLEGIEMYGIESDTTAWDQISSHVGTRNREECIGKFLELPIQDNYLNSTNSQAKAIPFIDAENPIMSIVSWLASMIHPNVAAAAASAALAEYEKVFQDRATPAHQEDTQLDPEIVNKIASIIIQSAAEKSTELIKIEEQKIGNYLAVLIEIYIKKIEIKMQHFDLIEAHLEADRLEVEKEKLALYEERIKLSRAIQEMKEKTTNRQKEKEMKELEESMEKFVDMDEIQKASYEADSSNIIIMGLESTELDPQVQPHLLDAEKDAKAHDPSSSSVYTRL